MYVCIFMLNSFVNQDSLFWSKGGLRFAVLSLFLQPVKFLMEVLRLECVQLKKSFCYKKTVFIKALLKMSARYYKCSFAVREHLSH